MTAARHLTVIDSHTGEIVEAQDPLDDRRSGPEGGGMTAGYVPETCANCRHAKGDHRASGSLSLIVTFGRCLADGCDCRVFTVHVDTGAARDAA